MVAWVTDDGRPMRDVLETACQELGAMLHWDLSIPGAEKYMQKGEKRVNVLSYQGAAAVAQVGQPVRTVEERNWIRMTGGQLYAEPAGL